MDEMKYQFDCAEDREQARDASCDNWTVLAAVARSVDVCAGFYVVIFDDRHDELRLVENFVFHEAGEGHFVFEVVSVVGDP
jgi:hypothetical protein